MKGEVDVEGAAGRAELPKNNNLEHEYSIPSTVKFAWLGTYFFFSLLLTLYNKLVLGMVSYQSQLYMYVIHEPMLTCDSSSSTSHGF